MRGRKTPERLLLALLGAVTACGYWHSNTVDLEPTADVPVQIVQVQMRHSLVAGLGTQPVSLSSSDGPNGIGVDYKTRVTGTVPEYAGIRAGLVCLVGDRAVRSIFAHDANRELEKAKVDDRVQGSATLMPSAFQNEIPTVCEAEFFYGVVPPLVAGKPGDPPRVEPPSVSLGRACLVDKNLRAGPCTATELPRVPADTPLSVTAIQARIGTLESGAYGLTYNVMVTTGADVPDDWTVGARAQCEVGGVASKVQFISSINERHIPPGESVTGVATSTRDSALATQPDRCTLSLVSRVGEMFAPIAEYCVKGETATAGACEGLAASE